MKFEKGELFNPVIITIESKEELKEFSDIFDLLTRDDMTMVRDFANKVRDGLIEVE